MQLEDYFDFITEPVEAIRIKGTRLDIEAVLRRHREGMTPEQIAAFYGAGLSLECVYATVTYDLRNRSAVDNYLKRSEALGEANYQRYLAEEESPLLKRLKAAKKARAQGQ